MQSWESDALQKRVLYLGLTPHRKRERLPDARVKVNKRSEGNKSSECEERVIIKDEKEMYGLNRLFII